MRVNHRFRLKVRFLVDLGVDGKPLYGYVMKIHHDWFEEDQAAKLAELKAQEDTMYENARRSADYGTFKPE